MRITAVFVTDIPEGLLCDGLVRRVVVLLQVRVCEGLLHQDPRVGVEREHSLQQVQCLAVSVGVEF